MICDDMSVDVGWLQEWVDEILVDSCNSNYVETRNHRVIPIEKSFEYPICVEASNEFRFCKMVRMSVFSSGLPVVHLSMNCMDKVSPLVDRIEEW